MDKHPISKGQDDEFTTCWREHREGWVCLLPEGHRDLDTLLPDAMRPYTDLDILEAAWRDYQADPEMAAAWVRQILTDGLLLIEKCREARRLMAVDFERADDAEDMYRESEQRWARAVNDATEARSEIARLTELLDLAGGRVAIEKWIAENPASVRLLRAKELRDAIMERLGES